MAHNAVSFAKTFRQDSEAFSRISLYTQRLVNKSKTLLKQLKDVQAERIALEKAERPDAVRIFKLKQMLGEPFDPAANGFVSSLETLRLHMRRDRVENNSFLAKSCDFNRVKYDELVQKAAA
jgi:hypothetical protein